MGIGRQLRSAFTPEALSTFDHTMDEVCTELLADGSLSPANLDVRSNADESGPEAHYVRILRMECGSD